MRCFEPQVELLEYILSGEAVLWIGAGASAEMGYPTWEQQAMLARQEFESNGMEYDKEGFEAYCKRGDFAGAFSALAHSVGKKKLLNVLQRVTVATNDGNDSIYNAVTKWPICSYVTTNFDNEIQRHLEQNQPELRYTVVGNADEDLLLLGEDIEHMIFKIHGTLFDEKNSVVTAEDYHNFTGKKEFYKGLLRLFKKKKIIIIGYGIGDRDVQFALEMASKHGKATNPIYLMLADVSETEAAIKKNVYNVKIIPYVNSDKRHTQLGKILANYSLFLSSTRAGRKISHDAREAVQLFMFRSLNQTAKTIDANNYVLIKSPDSMAKAIALDALINQISVRQVNVSEVVEELVKAGLMVADRAGCVKRTDDGDKKVDEVKARSSGIAKVAYDNFVQEFDRPLTSSQDALVRDSARICIEAIFDKLGLELLRSIYQSEDFDGYTLRDMYETIADVSKGLDDVDLRLAFIRAIRSFIVSPTHNQKIYLASLSQGYVMYHMLGQGRTCSDELDKIASKDIWFVDSNVIQPLLAKGCPAYLLTLKMFQLIKAHGVRVRTTQNVIREVYSHFEWARKHIPGVVDFKTVSSVPENDDGYNFFIAGYVEMMMGGQVIGFDEYTEEIGADDASWIYKALESYGVVIESGNVYDSSEFKTACDKITALRKTLGALSNNSLQVPTDADLYLSMCSHRSDIAHQNDGGNIYFLSSSGLFRRTDEKFVNWSVPKFIRYISLLSGRFMPIETLSDCLRSELCSSGILVVDEKNLDEYFGSSIRTADLNLAKEKKRLGRLFYDIAEMTEEELATKLQRIPPYERPEFTQQLISRVHEQALDEARSKSRALELENTELARKVDHWRGLYEREKVRNDHAMRRSVRKNRKKAAQKRREMKHAKRNRRK